MGKLKDDETPEPKQDFGNAHLISVFGPFNSRALVECSAEAASEVFGGLTNAGRSDVIDGVRRDVDAIRLLDADLADSGIAAAAIRLAYEIDHPFNSATSKAQCAKALRENLELLREIAPEAPTKDGIDAANADRASRREGKAKAED